MMKYYVNNTPQENGDHEVHKEGCHRLSKADDVTPLSYHTTCHSAVWAAQLLYPDTANGCKTCSPTCHTL